MQRRWASFWTTGMLVLFGIGFFILFDLFLLLRAESEELLPSLAEESGFLRGPSKAQNRRAREQWYWKQRTYPGDRIPAQVHRQAILNEFRSSTGSAAGQTRWESIGPGPIENVTMYGSGDLRASGRALAIAVHPTNPDILLLGAAQGGVWRSVNGGRNFAPVADNMPSLAIKVIRFAQSNPDVVYAGSGEPHSKTSIFGMGVYKSTDGGQTWIVQPSHGAGWDFRYVAISGLRIDPANSDIVYVTTANILPNRVNVFEPPLSAPSTGIFKSADGGQTWRCTQSAIDYRDFMYASFDPYPQSGLGFMDLELFAANPSILFATEMSGGIYRSIDFGEHWERVTPVKNPGGIADAGPDFPAPVPTYYFYDPDTLVFQTYDVIPRDKTVPEFNRIEISLAQSGKGITSDYRTMVLYAGVGATVRLDRNSNGVHDAGTDLEAPVGLLFKSTDGGQTWKWLGDWSKGVPNYCNAKYSVEGQGGEVEMDCLYDNTVEVNPANRDDVVIGGTPNYNTYWPDPLINPTRMLKIPWNGVVYRSEDGGTTWSDTTPACARYVPEETVDKKPVLVNGIPAYECHEKPSDRIIHPDIHSATYDWEKSRFYVTSDGGLHRCLVGTDEATGEASYRWETLNNNLSTLQFFNFGPQPTDPDKIVGGMQDNSAAYWNGTFWDAWDWQGCDGNVARFDPSDPRRVYLGCQYSLARSDDAKKDRSAWQWLFGPSGIGTEQDHLPFVIIFEIDPVETNIVYVGSEKGLYRSAIWGDDLTSQNRLNTTALDGQVTAISVSPKDHNKVWVGTSKGQVYLFDVEKGEVDERTGPNFPNRWISTIKASPNSEKAVTVTFSGYDSNSKDKSIGGNGNVGKVFRSTNMGKRWIDISGNMTEENDLDVPVSALVVDPQDEKRMWVGTDTGVYQTVNRGKTWTSYRGNMPAVAIMALEYNLNTGYLMAATFGRSIWRTIVSPGRRN